MHIGRSVGQLEDRCMSGNKQWRRVLEGVLTGIASHRCYEAHLLYFWDFLYSIGTAKNTPSSALAIRVSRRMTIAHSAKDDYKAE